jgi:hypothetical protein
MTTETKKTLQDVARILERSIMDDHSINIGGNVVNSQVGQTLTNCTNRILQQEPGERKKLLEALDREVRDLIARLPAEKTDEAPQIVENLEMLVKQATSEKPNPKWYGVSAEGLLEAATWVQDFTGKIGGTLLNLGKAIWPDFKLPGSN